MTAKTAAPKKRTPADQKIRDEIRTKLGGNMCVEAGAGTGKTTSLVDRIVELLATTHTDADHVGVITFTEKAAAELSSRVREQLERAIAEETDADRRVQLTEAVRALYRSRIETIHAFAANVLRERPVEAGLDPEYSILSTLETELLFDERYTVWLDELMSAEHPEVERALNLGMALDDFRTAAETLHRFRYLLPLAPFDPSEADTETLIKWLANNLSELEGIRDRCLEEDSGALPEIEKLVSVRDRFEVEGTTDAARDRIAAQRLLVPKDKGSQSEWEDPEDCRRMKTLFREYREVVNRLPTALRSNALLGVLPFLEAFVSEYEEHRRQEGLADFDDILIWARNVLRDNLDVRGYFQRRFDALLIDEFQDTDPIQVEIATYLTAEGQKGTEWRQLVPSEGKLFVVGDPKQSIYRFRRADIAIYDRVKRSLLADGLREITQNFRSSAPLIEWVNRTFDELLKEVQGVQPANVELKPWHQGVIMDHPPVVVVRGHDAELNSDGVREAESVAIASLLRDATMTDDGEDSRWQVRDPATEDVRYATPGDVAILLPTRGGLDAYEEALARAGLPFRHEGSRDYFQRDEVRDFVFLLQAIDDPLDRLALVGALRSPAFGCSDDDIVIHAGSGGSWDYRSDTKSDSERVVEAHAVLRELHWQRAKLSLPELVEKVLDRSRLVEFALTLPDGAQAAANLLGIVDQARAFTAAAGGGPRAFTRWLAQHAERHADEVDTDIAEEGDDVVRLLTMHGSKGLEFPIVVMANLATGGWTQKEPVPDEEHRRLHFRVGVGTKNGYYDTPDYEAVWDQEKGAQLAEQIRLLYVAATRARDHLVIPDIQGKQKRGFLLESLEPLLPEGQGHEIESDGVWLLDADKLELPEEEAIKPRKVPKREVTQASREREKWMAGHEETLSNAREELELIIASSVERSVRPLAAEASHSAGAMLVSEGPPLEIGDALHIVMERVSLPGAEDLDEVAAAICTEAGIPDHTDEVIQLAQRCLESPTVTRALELGTYRREVPFTVPHDRGYSLGRVDLLFHDGEGLQIVDFKTDDVKAQDTDAHTLEHHAGQASAYLEALPRAMGLSVEGITFVYCRSGSEVNVGPDGALVQDV